MSCFELAGSLRFAAVCRAALNHVDLDAATAAGVVVVHTPGRNAQAVAELVLGQMVALARMIAASHDYVVGKRWEDPSEPYVRFRGRELAGATLGVVGLGDIGRRVASLGRAVGMRVLAHDPYVREAREAPPGRRSPRSMICWSAATSSPFTPRRRTRPQECSTLGASA